ncbi:hypothetical protein FF1_037504 [Malus domestica]
MIQIVPCFLAYLETKEGVVFFTIGVSAGISSTKGCLNPAYRSLQLRNTVLSCRIRVHDLEQRQEAGELDDGDFKRELEKWLLGWGLASG